MRENNRKWNNWKRINFQSIQAAQTTQYQRNNPIKKWGKDLNVSPKKTYRLLTNTWNDAQHRSLWEKCKSKLQWDITSHRSEWPSSESLQTINAGEGVEKRECSCNAGGKGNWFSHYGRCMEIPLKTRNQSTIWPSKPTHRHIHQGHQNWKRHMYPIVHCSSIYNS